MNSNLSSSKFFLMMLINLALIVLFVWLVVAMYLKRKKEMDACPKAEPKPLSIAHICFNIALLVLSVTISEYYSKTVLNSNFFILYAMVVGNLLFRRSRDYRFNEKEQKVNRLLNNGLCAALLLAGSMNIRNVSMGKAVGTVGSYFFLVGVICLVFGNYLPKIRSNIWVLFGVTEKKLFGIKLPEYSEEAVSKTNKIGGKTMFICGLVFLLVGLPTFIVPEFYGSSEQIVQGLGVSLLVIFYLAPFIIAGYFQRTLSKGL